MMPAGNTGRIDVLRWLDNHGGSQGRTLANQYRADHGLKLRAGCVKCGTEGGHYVCPESDRVIFACSNYKGDQ